MTEGLRKVVRVLLHTGDTPHRTALAFGIGVFIAFSPFLGVHMWIALLIAVLFRLNRVAILAGTYLNNPWTFAPMYLAGTSFGCFLLGMSSAGLSAIDWNLHGRAFYRHLRHVLRPYLWPFLLGNTILGVLCGLLGYLLLRRMIEHRRAAAARVAASVPAP
ncbi:MAG TPA: DUF2062 domain-containing protein [Vicinamibacteria bacterium]|nr:DUF2062 domain-containing protein [Vicinamibacteria bacterium]